MVLGKLLITYLTKIRPVELIFIYDLHGKEAYKVLRTHVWYREKGKTLHETDGLTSIMVIWMLQVLGLELGVMEWRQLAASLARRVLKGVIEIESEETTTLFEHGFGHTGTVGLSNYGTSCYESLVLTHRHADLISAH